MRIMQKIQQMTFADVSEEYKQFMEKFKPKHTTDDCFTPENIYTVVRNWVINKYNIPNESKIIRPFYPGGDYQREEYPDGCVVIDNPPFSILSKICTWYDRAGINYFLFAPALTLFTRGRECNYIVTGANITYANGAQVSTSFITNMGEYLIENAIDLRESIQLEDKKNRKDTTRTLPKYKYPDAIVTAAAINYLTVHHTPIKIARHDALFVRSLDAQIGTAIFGGGFLLTEHAAAEHAAAVVFKLSARERAIQRYMAEQIKRDEKQ